MEALHHLVSGFSVALQPMHLFYCFIGVLGGTLVGVLPAIGPVAAIAILLPTVYYLEPTSAIIMLAGIQNGCMYGGTITSVLVNVPGEAASVVTCLEGYPMALNGRAGAALGIAAFGSFIGANIGMLGLVFFAQVVSRLALHLGPPEYFALMVLSLTTVVYVVKGSSIKAGMMVSLGVLLSCVGVDVQTSQLRFTFNLMSLYDGIPLVPAVIGLFGIKEVFGNFEKGDTSRGELLTTKIQGIFPTWQDWKDSLMPIFRGSFLGFFMGVLPGISPTIPTFVSYGIEKRLSKHPEKFGKGAIEGVAGPESANNATVCGGYISLFGLGIPTTALTSMLLAALIIFGMSPGPQFIEKSPDLFWGLIASLYVGNVLLLMLNLPFIPLWVKVLRTPFYLLNILILIFCVIGAYCMNGAVEDMYMVFIFGLVGIVAKKLDFEPAPLVMGLILGPMIERSLTQSLILSDGSVAIFMTRPITAVLLVIAVILLIFSMINSVRGKVTRSEA